MKRRVQLILLLLALVGAGGCASFQSEPAPASQDENTDVRQDFRKNTGLQPLDTM